MKTSRLGLLVAVVVGVMMLVLVAGPALAQDDQPPRQAERPERVRPEKPDLSQPVPPEQLLAAQLMASKGLEMMPDQLARDYGLSDEQKEAARTILQNRWTAMPQQDKDALFRVAIQGRQLVMSRQAEPGDWQQLSRAAQPAMTAMFKMFNDAADDFRPVLDEKQREKFDSRMAEFAQVQQSLQKRAQLVADGEVKLDARGEPTDGADWPQDALLPHEITRRENRDMQIVEEDEVVVGPDGAQQIIKVKRIKSKLPDEQTVAGNEKYWTPFLKGYLVKFNLDETQTNQARKFLGEAIGRARTYRTQMKPALDEAAGRVKQAEADNDARALEIARMNYDRLNQPVVRIFGDLRRQLDTLLTATQRTAGATRGELFGPSPK